MYKLISPFINLFESLIRNQSGDLGRKIRRFYYKKRLGSCGKNLLIDEGVIIQGAKNIFFGDNIWIDKYCVLIAGKVELEQEKVRHKKNKNYHHQEGELHIASNAHIAPFGLIQAHGGLSIGENLTASANCKIYSLSNDVAKCREGTQFNDNIYYVKSSISIGKNVWLGLNTIVLAGNIAKDCFISPNSVLVKDIEENSFASGNPAKRIKKRFEEL